MRTTIYVSLLAALSISVTAAELPKKHAAPRDVKVNPCKAYGAGYVRVEGTTTCVKVGVSVSVDAGSSR
jgi:hypothetical protein